MANYAAVYTLATPGGTILFNNGTLDGIVDLYWIQTLPGLDFPEVRNPTDRAPQVSGSLVHKRLFAGLQFSVQGLLIVRSVPFGGSACQGVLDVMEENLRNALLSIGDTAGTLSWTTAVGGQSLSVYIDVKLDVQPEADYTMRTFTFGLQAASATY